MTQIIATGVALYALPALALYFYQREAGGPIFDRSDAWLALTWPRLPALAIVFMWVGRDAGEA